MPVPTIREIYDAARAAGFGEQQAVTWTAIALARSAEGARTDYRAHLAKVEQEIGIKGDFSAISGYAPSPPASHQTSQRPYDQIDTGYGLGPEATPGSQSGTLPTIGGTAGDSDRDGLSDVFERLVGTDAARMDSDGDGLIDGFEASASGTDPLSVDTDLDGTTDGFEVDQRRDPLSPLGGSGVPRWTIEAGTQRRLADMMAAARASQSGGAPPQAQPPITTAPAAPGPARDLNGGRVSSDGAEPRLVVALDAAGSGNWQAAVKAGQHWFLGQATAGDRSQIFHRLNSDGKEIDQMTVVGAAHCTSFAVIGNTVYATYDGEVVTFPYQPGATITGEDTTPTGWKGHISIDPTHRFAVLRKGNHYRAYDLATREPIGKEVVTPRGGRQGFSIVGDTLYVLTGKTNAPARVDSYSFTTGKQTGTQDVTAVGPGRHREPEGMFGDLMGVKTGLGAARRLKIYQLDTGVPPATDERPDTDSPPSGGAAQHVDTEEVGNDGDHVKFGGKTVDRRTAAMLTEAERLANVEDPSIGRFNLTQGSFSHSVGASAGTHGGPGAFDMYTRDYSSDQKKIIGLALRKVGFASWLRRESQGPWDEHWHGIAIGAKGLPSAAASQVDSYLDGRNGLRGNGKDTDPRPDQILTWEQYRKERASLDRSRESSADPAASGGQSGGEGPAMVGDQLDPAQDSDADGLTDVFERLALSDPGRPDTDGDGLFDGYEITASRTDPLLVDSDLDGFTDAAELRHGSNPLGVGLRGTEPPGSTALDPVGQTLPPRDPAAASGGLLEP